MKNTLVAFVDGSFSINNPDKYGCGLILIEPDGNEIEFSYANDNKDAVKLRNVAGELSATLKAMVTALEMGYKELVIYHDYTGIRCWITGEWKCKNNITKAYKDFYENNIKGSLDVHFVWIKGHSGNEYNEKVDRLARKSLGI